MLVVMVVLTSDRGFCRISELCKPDRQAEKNCNVGIQCHSFVRQIETIMAAQKRSLEDASTSRKVKKLKTESEKNKSKPHPPSTALTEEVDFPRGGGTSFTPLEVKAFRAEAMKEANVELFKVCFSF
jgi:hypothetical protein